MDNTNIIVIDINDKEDIFNKFNKEQLSDELVQYILMIYKKNYTNKDVKIVINDKVNLTQKEKEYLVDTIRKHFGLLVREKSFYTRFNSTKNLALFIIGVLLILLSDLLSSIFEFLIPELFLISGWVAIWEMVYSILFADRKNKIERRIAKELSKCDIEFK